MAKSKIFVDSSVLISAVLSTSGGSFYILNNFKEQLDFRINQYVLDEILVVLERKFSDKPDLKNNLFLILAVASITLLPDPADRDLKQVSSLINKEDAPILVSALEHGNYLLTLDNDFLNSKIKSFAQDNGLGILKPKEFIEKFGMSQ